MAVQEPLSMPSRHIAFQRCEVCGADMRSKKPWLYACGECGFMASTLQPAEGTGVGGLEALRRQNFEIMLDKLEQITSMAGARILEIGAAWGWFLEAVSRRGGRARGIEPELANAELCRQHGFDVEDGFFPVDLRDCRPYDIIVFNDVFEHLIQPSIVIKKVEALLKPSGLAVINLPSSDGVLFKIATMLDTLGSHSWLERLWQKDFASPHVSYFNPDALRRLVESHTSMTRIQAFSLKSVSRDGLRDRIGSSHRSISGVAAAAALWSLSFILPLLPADIHVSVFRNPIT